MAGPNVTIEPDPRTRRITISATGAAAGGDITAVLAGTGLAGGADNGEATLALAAAYQDGNAFDARFVNEGQAGAIGNAMLAAAAVTGNRIADGTIGLVDLGRNGALDGQILKWSDAANAWVMAADEHGATGTTYSAGAGLNLAGAVFSVDFAAVAARAHAHAGEDIASGTVAEARIAAALARDAEVFGLVLASDGADSGLDADLLDGLDATAFAEAAHLHDGRYYTETELDTSGGGGQVHWANLTNLPAGFADGLDNDTLYSAGAGLTLAGTVFGVDFAAVAAAAHAHAGEELSSGTVAEPRIAAALARDAEVLGLVLAGDGSGSGLDADLLDGLDATAFAEAAHLHDERYYTETELTSSGGGGQVHWNNLVAVPPGLVDGSAFDARFVNEGEPDSIGTGMLAGNAVTAAKIAPDVVSSLDGVSNDGGSIDLVPGSGITITPDDGVNTITIAATPATASCWSLSGNSDTNPDLNYLGTSDNHALVFKVNAQRGLRLEPVASASEAPNLIGGYGLNRVTTGVVGATIAGGGAYIAAYNQVTDSYGTVSGGIQNQAGDDLGTPTDAVSATVGGGGGNKASASYATVGGGFGNRTTAPSATVAGGGYNQAMASYATIAGGGPWAEGEPYNTNNRIYDDYGSIGGGGGNRAGSDDGATQDTTNARYATVAGGWANEALAACATIGGGGPTGNRHNTVYDEYGVIAGGCGNWAGSDDGVPQNTGNALYATVGGGYVNHAHGEATVVAGGNQNFAAGPCSTVGGGFHNSTWWGAAYATIAGGGPTDPQGQAALDTNNRVYDDYGTIGGGGGNRAGSDDGVTQNPDNARYATVAGGNGNLASGSYSTVPGGSGNTAAGRGSFAAGYLARASHDGSFVWADCTEAYFDSTVAKEFAVRADNGMRVVASNASCGAVIDNRPTSNGGDGLRAFASASKGDNWAAVFAINEGTSPAIYGYSSAGPAAYLDGPVTVTGWLTKPGGSFKIDHPLDPQNKTLSHSFVESPDMKNIYDGVVTLDANGEAWVELPDWFEALNRDFRYQLTAIGGPGPNLHIAEEVKGNRFKIAGGPAGLKVSWQVTGSRQDGYAKLHPIAVEQDKPAAERGTYLCPEAFAEKR